MLVLGRKVGEEIVIGNLIRLVVVDIRQSQVRLGFVAPREVSILRHEVQDKLSDYQSEDMERTKS
jgi:carbon storage regulator CsrA